MNLPWSSSMGTLGERLRLARERAGLSVHDIAASTKIQVSLLEAIERDDFEHVPGGLFVRGFLRAYAREVGLPPEPVVADYLAQCQPERPAAQEVAERPEADLVEDVIPAQEDIESFSWRRVWPAVAIAATVIGVFFAVGTRSRNIPVAEAEAVGTSGKAGPSPAVPARRNGGTLTLTMRARRDVWVAASADGQRVMYRILKAGEQASLSARNEITARVGDAEAFDYSVNGVAGQPLGQPGEVHDILIKPDSFRTFKVDRPASRPAKTGT